MCACVRLLTKSSVTYFSTFFCCDSVFIPVMITAQLGTTEYIYTMKEKKKKTYICSVEISVSFFITDSGALLLTQPLKQVP